MPVYTRTGDQGETSLFGGKRVYKSSSLVDAYGLVDELNSHIGLIVSTIDEFEVQDFLRTIQSDLFIIGSHLGGYNEGLLDDIQPRVSALEKRIDRMEESLPKITSFILPGGTALSSTIHITRSICRKAERRIVFVFQKKLDESSHITTQDFHIIIRYLNRLSDFFFVLARFVNHAAKVNDIVWNGMKSTHTNTPV